MRDPSFYLRKIIKNKEKIPVTIYSRKIKNKLWYWKIKYETTKIIGTVRCDYGYESKILCIKELFRTMGVMGVSFADMNITCTE